MECTHCGGVMELKEQYGTVVAVCRCGSTAPVWVPLSMREVMEYRGAVTAMIEKGGT